jgi:hypothetical protein
MSFPRSSAAGPHLLVWCTRLVCLALMTLWQAPVLGAIATSHLVRAGSAPGRSNLAYVDTGSTATTASFSGVPSSVYYVRVHRVNTLGASIASNEVTVVVP